MSFKKQKYSFCLILLTFVAWWWSLEQGSKRVVTAPLGLFSLVLVIRLYLMLPGASADKFPGGNGKKDRKNSKKDRK